MSRSTSPNPWASMTGVEILRIVQYLGEYCFVRQTQPMRTFFVALRALVFVVAFVFLWSWLALGVRTFDHTIGILLPAWTRIPGMVLMGAGGILALVCVGLFIVCGRGTPAIFDAPRAFVAVGPYRYVRNPMYIGALMVLTGFGLSERSLSIIVFSLLWLIIIQLFVVYFEEPGLKERFGASYGEYCKAVPRWIPR